MDLHITEEDILGATCDSYNCPLARALSRQLQRPMVVGLVSWTHRGDINFASALPLPAEAYRFRRAYDLGEPVQPTIISFDR